MNAQLNNMDGLIEFLNFTSKSGYANSKTVTNRINIVKEIFATVPDINNSDITQLDVDEVFNRYTNLMKTKRTPKALQGNKSHFKSSLREYKEYLNDPIHYKPQNKSSKSKITKSIEKQKTEKNKPNENENPMGYNTPPNTDKADNSSTSNSQVPLKNYSNAPTIHIDFQIHIAPDTSPELIEKIFESLNKYYPNK
jgi:hypothetical protein